MFQHRQESGHKQWYDTEGNKVVGYKILFFFLNIKGHIRGWSWGAPQNHVPPAEIATLAIRDRVLCEEAWVENTVKIPPPLPPQVKVVFTTSIWKQEKGPVNVSFVHPTSSKPYRRWQW